jgi:hypothetical protein
MTKKTNNLPKANTAAFEHASQISLGNKTYLIERHFTGSRDFSQAVFTAAANEAGRDRLIIKAG